jgi:Adenylate and Guanylate cyclase catalytic domain
LSGSEPDFSITSDLRDFTSFSAGVAPEQVMSVLTEYYEALGRAITTLFSFAGDDLMVLVNAPVPVEEPALRAVDLAVEMQRSVQELIVCWRARGYQIEFGVSLASGSVGRSAMSRIEIEQADMTNDELSNTRFSRDAATTEGVACNGFRATGATARCTVNRALCVHFSARNSSRNSAAQ